MIFELEFEMEVCFSSCLAFTRAEEGGYVDDPRDSGNWSSGHVGQGRLIGSNMGVGAPALLAWMGPSAYVTSEQMRDLQPSIYRAIARSNYWMRLGCTSIPNGLDLMAFDFGWNRGPTTSLLLLGRCLNIQVRSVADVTGQAIISALDDIPASILLERIPPGSMFGLQRRLGIVADGIAGRQTLSAFSIRSDLRPYAAILAFAAAQVASYRQLSNFSVYGVGWLARTARRQAIALELADGTAANPVAA